jgi:polysaccharide biosynthesis protein PelA
MFSGKKQKSFLILNLFLLITLSFNASSNVKRHILALYSGSESEDIAFHPLHLYAELPLNHLGFVLKYWDVDKGLPSFNDIDDCKAIITWFLNGQSQDPLGYIKWATSAIEKGFKFIILGNIGAEENLEKKQTSLVSLNILLKTLGVERKEIWVNPYQIQKFIYNNPEILNFERKLDMVQQGFNLQNNISAGGHSILSAELKDGLVSDLILVTPKGAIATEGYFLYLAEESASTQQKEIDSKIISQWYINPFAFFREILGSDDLPKADTTTLCGNRIFYNHINGLGWRNISEIAHHHKKGLSAIDVIYKDILSKHPELPVTIGPIMADLDPSWVGTQKSQEIAKKIFELPHVEAASHSYSFPENTNYYLKNKNLAEEKKDLEHSIMRRLYLNEPYNAEKEFKGSIDYLQKILPPSKNVKLYLWPGNCLPNIDDLKQLDTLQMLNLNGGRNRYDAEYPSYSSLSPTTRQIGPYLQIYASSSNETSYTYGWRERFFGLKFLTSTFLNTDRPIRLKPINLSYNALSGQKKSSMAAIEEVLDYVKFANINPIFASDYVQIVQGFYTTQFNLIDTQTWEIKNRHTLQTIRFDNASLSKINFKKSKGVLGAKHIYGSLYVSLDPKIDTPIVALENNDQIDGPPPAESPYLLNAHWQISDFSTNRNTFEFNLNGFGSGEMNWYCPEKGTYNVTFIQNTEQKVGTFTLSQDHILTIPLHFPSIAQEKVKIVKIENPPLKQAGKP